ncbi:tetratricopeptide repeat protein [Psychromonas sp. MME2]|uniref:tetratricopeptide repeat protein n=1 Tax=unclassified Psychromonas TaxID=2614957 RepID=UPI00339BB12B
MQSTSHDVTISTFPQIIIEGSKQQPVLVVFWSPQSPVCNTLLPLLEKLHNEGNQTFTLAKINCDIEQQIVNHFGVQSVPSVFIFKDGQGIDGFAGEQSEAFIRTFISKHTPDPALALLNQGQTLFAQGHLDEAKKVLLEASKIAAEQSDIKLALAQVYLALGEHESSKHILQDIPLNEQNMIYNSLVSQLQLAMQSTQTPEIVALEAQLQSSPDDMALLYQLAGHYQQVKRNSEALPLLYKILLTDLGYENGEAKQMILTILAKLDDAALVGEYRRKVYSLLY